ncbi:MAG: PAS domain S-box protein [Parachlamydiaceae bacterium]|nr:PAS domain S-box protein [Parachlamydiaceae bacterium]
MQNKLHSKPDHEISAIDHYIADMDNNAKILADNSSLIEDIDSIDAFENPQENARPIVTSDPISVNINKVSQDTMIGALEFQLTHIEQLRSNILWIAGITIPLLSFILYKLSRKLERSKEFLDNIINSMPSPMIILDDKAKIMLWNLEAEKQTSTTLEKVNGKAITEVFTYLESEKQKILASIHSNEPQKIDKITQRTTHGNAYFELLIYPLKGKKFHGTALIIQDITQRIHLMESLQQQDRLASIGLLIAGIAHEINNPVNFITANVKSIKNDVKDVLEVLNQYSQITTSTIHDFTDFKNSIDKINAYKQEVNLVYTIDEIEKLLAGLEEGALRTATIVKGLRTFARVNDSEMISTDILEGIESTLALLRNTYKDRIDIVKEYEQIPFIDCYEGKLNQVFMNLLSNAVCAIKGKGKIYIKVSKELNSIRISIRDTGEGIKEENKPKIFMPFFTTKDVGQGTGLGLSITHNIILEHHGTLVFNSEEGSGTEFIITLPITHPKATQSLIIQK